MRGPERCEALHPSTRPSGSLRCVKATGHGGPHADTNLRLWTNTADRLYGTVASDDDKAGTE